MAAVRDTLDTTHQSIRHIKVRAKSSLLGFTIVEPPHRAFYCRGPGQGMASPFKVCSPRVDRVFPKNLYLITKPTEIVLCAHSIAIIIILVSFVTDRMIIKYTLCMIQDQEIMKLYGQKKSGFGP